MTHDELLARIKEGQWVDKEEMHKRSNALRFVVETHVSLDGLICATCRTEYPCRTIRLIEKELK